MNRGNPVPLQAPLQPEVEIRAIDADVIGLMEIQNNANEAAQNLVDGLNAAIGAGTYTSIALPAAGTVGTSSAKQFP